MPKFSERVGWLVPGQMLLVNGQILPIQDCQIVLSRQQRKLNQEDRVPTVEFWFSRPIQGATAYIPKIQAGKIVLTQAICLTADSSASERDSPRIYAGTTQGLYVLDTGQQLEMEGNSITALATLGTGLWAIVCRSSIRVASLC